MKKVLEILAEIVRFILTIPMYFNSLLQCTYGSLVILIAFAIDWDVGRLRDDLYATWVVSLGILFNGYEIIPFE